VKAGNLQSFRALSGGRPSGACNGGGARGRQGCRVRRVVAVVKRLALAVALLLVILAPAVGCAHGVEVVDDPDGGADGQAPAADDAAAAEGGGGCASFYMTSSCPTYQRGTTVERRLSGGGARHNWLCVDDNCRNCGSDDRCAPARSGCPWGMVWADEGPCL